MSGPIDVSAETMPVTAGTPAMPGNGAGFPATATSPKRAKPPRVIGRTTRVVLRRLDPWTVLKLSVAFYLALLVVLLVAGVLLWAGATAFGVIGNVEGFMEDVGFAEFRFIPNEILVGAALGGLVLVVVGTFANVLMTVLFNLLGDIVGGVKLTLQEDVDTLRAPGEGKSTV